MGMRILVVGPDHGGGSLPPYIDAFAAGLREHGATVCRLGSPGLPRDTAGHRFWPIERILDAAEQLAREVDLDSYDLLSFNFGNLEVEQLLPVLWADRPHPPAVLHVHALAPTLFRDSVPDEKWVDAVDNAIRAFDGYVYFGGHARDLLAGQVPSQAPAGVAWLPTTAPPDTAPVLTPAMSPALDVADGTPVISLYGFPAPWKDLAAFCTAVELMTVPARVVLAGQDWDLAGLIGVDLRHAIGAPARLGVAEFVVVPDYVGPANRAALMRASRCGFFPYRHYASAGSSGAIVDYLGNGVPVVAADVFNLAELVGDAGIIVPAGDARAMAAALDQVAGDATVAARLTHAAAERAPMFTVAYHVERCLDVYRRVLGR